MVKSQDTVGHEAGENEEKTILASQYEEKIKLINKTQEQENELADIFSIHGRIQSKIDLALVILKEILVLTFSLNQRLSAGSYFNMNLAKRLKLQLLIHTVNVAVNQLSKVNKIFKLVILMIKEEATHPESSTMFE